MSKSTSLVFAFVLIGASLFEASICQAQVTAEVREGTVVILAAEPVEAAGLELLSPAGNLSPVPDPPGASPFTFFLSNTANQITWGNLGTSTTLDGAFNTRAGYAGDPAGDLTAAWGDGPTPVDIPVSLSGEPLPPNSGPPAQPPVVNPPVVIPNPPNESAVFGEIREGKVLLFSTEPTAMSGVDLQSPAGNLVPVDDRIGSAPFTFFLANSANQIVWGNLGSTVTLDGALNTNAGYNGDPAGDLAAFWGAGPVPVAFPVSLSGEPIPAGLESPVLPPRPDPPTNPPVINPPNPGGPATTPPPHDLPPSAKDGLLQAEIREGKLVVVSSEPVEAGGLEFVSQAGRLTPVPDPPGAAPFMFFLSNTPNQITWGNLGTGVTIDGVLATEAGYSGDPAGDLTGAWGDGPTPVSLPISVSGEVIPTPDPPTNPDPPVIPDPPANPDPGGADPPLTGPLSGAINDDGFVVLSASETITVAGIDLQSPAGNLVPVSDEVGAAPFAFFLSNTANQITWGNLGTGVELDGEFVTGAQYNGDPAGDLLAFWGDGPTPVAFAIGAGGGVAPSVPVDEIIPEPTGISLAWLGLLGLLGLRKRRK